MNNSEILNLIKAKELEVRKLQLEVEELKKQLNEITTNSAMDTSNREDVDYNFESYNELYDYVNKKIDSKKNIMFFLMRFKIFLNFRKLLIVYI